MKTVHLVILKPRESFEGMRRLLKWDRPRGTPGAKPGDEGHAKRIFSFGMVCELADVDLEEAKSFCDVTIVATKEVPCLS